MVWNYGNCADQCRHWNIVILRNFKQNRPTDVVLQTVWVLQILLILINLLSLPSDSFFNAIWPRIMKVKTFIFELRTLLVNDPLFVYFNVCFMTFVVLNTHWLNLLLSTFFSLFLSPEESSSPKSSFTWIPETLSPDESNIEMNHLAWVVIGKMFQNQISAEG